LIGQAAEDCDKIAKKHDAADSQARLVNREVIKDLKKCGSN
jgi:hypothetical protein